MRRVRRAPALMVAAAMILTACTSADTEEPPANSQPPASENRPNILFILTDDLDLGSMDRMPNLESLITDQGISFSNYFASVSLCCPARATTLRGQYAHNTGVLTNGGGNGGFEAAQRFDIEQSTIGTWMQAAGYRTALIGKYLNGYPTGVEPTYVPSGWDEWDSAVTATGYLQYNYTLNENGTLVDYGGEPDDYGTDVYVRKTIDFVTTAAQDDQPFFAWLSLYPPHSPATPAPQDVDAFPEARAPRTPSYNQADVSGMPQWIQDLPLMTPEVQQRVDEEYRTRIRSLQAVDRQLSNLIDTLRVNGQLDNTYIVFASDNGFHLGQHRMPAGKQTGYEEDIHIPLMVRGPGVPQGRTSDAIVGDIDLAPTFADLAGANVPDFVDGRSFAPQLREPETSNQRQAYLIEHWRETDPADATQPDSASIEPPDLDQQQAPPSTTPGAGNPGRVSLAAATDITPEFHGIRTDRYKYIEYSTGDTELYDLYHDPAEIDNLAHSADPALLSRLSDAVAALKDCRAAACRTAENVTMPR